MNFLDYILVVFFLLWIISSILRQIFHNKIASYDLLDLLPNCRFFAPRPLSHDYRIYVKGLNDDESSETNWLPIITYDRKWWNFIWNPKLKTIKTVFDLSVCFTEKSNLVQYHLPYLIILNQCNEILINNEKINKMKFMIVKYAGYDDQTFLLVFESKRHKIDRVLSK